MELLNKWVDRLDYYLALASGGTIFLMMIWIFFDVILRYFFNSPIVGTMELTGEYFMAIIVYLAVSYTQKEKGHVNVDLLLSKFSRGTKKITGIFTNLVALLVFIILGINNFEKGVQYFANDTRSVGLLDYPLGPALMIVSCGLFLLCIRLLVDSILIVTNKREFQ